MDDSLIETDWSIASDWSFEQWQQEINFFKDIDFSILYDWLPDDIGSVIAICLGFLFILAVLGLIKKIPFL